MRVLKIALVHIALVLLFSACQSERYRKDRENKLTKHADKASDYLADQAVTMTQENIKNRNTTEKKSRKRLEKQQKELNEANNRASKVKPLKKHRGDFKFY
jgi:septin family protein